jgi:hypothetical protein
MKKHHLLMILAAVLAVLWLQAEAERWQLRREIKRVYMGDVTVHAIDADTKATITITFHGPSSTMDQRWPKAFTMSTTGDLSKMAIRWIDIGDVDVGVSAEGYERVPLKLNATTSRELVIPYGGPAMPTNPTLHWIRPASRSS